MWSLIGWALFQSAIGGEQTFKETSAGTKLTITSFQVVVIEACCGWCGYGGPRVHSTMLGSGGPGGNTGLVWLAWVWRSQTPQYKARV